jgi:hypothetical protein
MVLFINSQAYTRSRKKYTHPPTSTLACPSTMRSHGMTLGAIHLSDEGCRDVLDLSTFDYVFKNYACPAAAPSVESGFGQPDAGTGAGESELSADIYAGEGAGEAKVSGNLDLKLTVATLPAPALTPKRPQAFTLAFKRFPRPRRGGSPLDQIRTSRCTFSEAESRSCRPNGPTFVTSWGRWEHG